MSLVAPSVGLRKHDMVGVLPNAELPGMADRAVYLLLLFKCMQQQRFLFWWGCFSHTVVHGYNNISVFSGGNLQEIVCGCACQNIKCDQKI